MLWAYLLFCIHVSPDQCNFQTADGWRRVLFVYCPAGVCHPVDDCDPNYAAHINEMWLGLDPAHWDPGESVGGYRKYVCAKPGIPDRQGRGILAGESGYTSGHIAEFPPGAH
jgi:hypothetical protein